MQALDDRHLPVGPATYNDHPEFANSVWINPWIGGTCS
jgi:hypothetical protein